MCIAEPPYFCNPIKNAAHPSVNTLRKSLTVGLLPVATVRRKANSAVVRIGLRPVDGVAELMKITPCSDIASRCQH